MCSVVCILCGINILMEKPVFLSISNLPLIYLQAAFNVFEAEAVQLFFRGDADAVIGIVDQQFACMAGIRKRYGYGSSLGMFYRIGQQLLEYPVDDYGGVVAKVLGYFHIRLVYSNGKIAGLFNMFAQDEHRFP